MKKTNGHKIYFSEKKFKVLKFIKDFIEKYNYSPTLFEIANQFGYSRARAGVIVRDLYKMGLIYKGESNHRKIRMTANQISSVKNLKFNREFQAHA
tara:strand:+ start:729 stop:1016 length:288 start_codon:yes stop_codon:yes gene_type:complete